MSNINYTLISCGVKQLYSLGAANRNPREIIRHAKDYMDVCAFFIYSDIVPNRGRSAGEKFTDFILEHELGTVFETDLRKNPNSGNRIRVWTWAPSKDNIRVYLRDSA